MTVLRRILAYLSHQIVWVHLHCSSCLLDVNRWGKKSLKIENKILRSFSGLRKMLWLLNLVHTLCVSGIHELFTVIKAAHVHLLILELFIILFEVFLKTVVLITRHTVLVRSTLAPEKRSVVII